MFKTKAGQKIKKYLREECVGCFFSTWRPYEELMMCDLSGKYKEPTDVCKKFKYSEFRKIEIFVLFPKCSLGEKKLFKKTLKALDLK